MKVLIKELHSGDKCYEYSEKVERHIARMVSNTLNAKISNETSGFAPEYDFCLNSKRIELKLTSRSNPCIEFSRADGRPSGLLLSESDYYLILSPGGSNGKFVGKLRMFKTVDLKEKMLKEISLDKNIRVYPADSSGPGSAGFILNPKEINDIWVGDCELILDDKKVMGFDLSTFKPSFGHFISEARRAIKC